MTGQQIQRWICFPWSIAETGQEGGRHGGCTFRTGSRRLTTLFEKSSEADGKNAAASLLAALGGTGDADDAV